MYTVRYSESFPKSSFQPVLFRCDDVETAVKFALSVHEISNVPHSIFVFQESDDPKIFREVLVFTLMPPKVSA